jgi:2-methylisocitrate lyase-like PEP mutase family enzyme
LVVSDQSRLAERFLALHRPEEPLLMPNPWDAGSAKLLGSLGFQALATTSSGSAATLGELDGRMGRERALLHAAQIVAATGLPVSADLENGFADEPDAVAETVAGAVTIGLAGFSIEDYTGRDEDPIYPIELAAERIAAAAEVAHAGESRLVLTARSENYLHGRADLDDTIARLQAYERAGADVLFAPGLKRAEEIGAVVEALSKPVSVLAIPGVPSVAELSQLGVCRVSVGGAFAFAAFGAVVEAARELREQGTYGYLEASRAGATVVREAFKQT